MPDPPNAILNLQILAAPEPLLPSQGPWPPVGLTILPGTEAASAILQDTRTSACPDLLPQGQGQSQSHLSVSLTSYVLSACSVHMHWTE